MAKYLSIILSLLLTVTIMIFSGCSKKEDTSELPVESTQPDSQSTESPKNIWNQENEANQEAAEAVTFDKVLEVWNNGQQTEAVDLFLGIEWEQGDIFASDSIFRISETDFAKLPEDQRLQVQQKAMKLTKDIKEISMFIVEQAKQKGQYETSRNALIACGKRLSSDDQLLLVQMVGKGIAGYAEKNCLSSK